jgi:hypothetical protein
MQSQILLCTLKLFQKYRLLLLLFVVSIRLGCKQLYELLRHAVCASVCVCAVCTRVVSI